jgi:hypothetical protein
MAMLSAAILGSGLLFGAQQPAVLVTVALLSAGAMFCLRPTATPRLAWLLFGLSCYTLLQIVPLPFAWVAALSPSSAEVWRGALDPLGEPAPKWITLSVDPTATALEVLKWFAYTCVFVAACGVRARRGPVMLAVLVTGSALAVCLVTLTHGILDIPRIYGLYKPTDATSQWLRGPFVNGNNLTGYLNLGLLCGVGLWLAPDKQFPKWPLALAVPLMIIQVLLASSRGGTAALILGLLVIGFVTVQRRRLVSAPVRNGVAIGIVASVALAFALGGSRIGAIFAGDVQGKTAAWRWSLDLISDFPVFGVGRGAFETAFQPYRQPLGYNWTMVYSYVENFPLQWANDWGVAVAVVALSAWAILVRRSVARALHDPLALGIAVAIGAVLLQNLVDLGFELFGVFALVMVAFAALVEPAPSGPRPRVPVGLLAGLGVLVGSVIVVATGATPARFERQQVAGRYAEWVRNGTPDPKGFLGDIRGSVLRHPGDAYFPLVGSAVAAKVRGSDPMRWVGRALERSPFDGHVHLRLADLLAARGARRQALIHLRLSALYDVILRDNALWKAAGLAQSADDLLSAFPRNLPGGTLLPEVCKRAAGPTRVACWREVISRDEADPWPKRELASALLDAIETGGTPCASEARAACRADVGRLLGELGRGKDDWRVSEIEARELVVEGKLREAATLLVERCPAKLDALGCCLRAVEVAGQANDLKLLGAAAERYAAVVCNEPRHCATGHDRIGQAYAAMGAFAIALRHFTVAAEHEPSVDRWIQNAEAAARAGLARSAEVALERARRESALEPERLRRIEAVQELIRNPPAP